MIDDLLIERIKDKQGTVLKTISHFKHIENYIDALAASTYLDRTFIIKSCSYLYYIICKDKKSQANKILMVSHISSAIMFLHAALKLREDFVPLAVLSHGKTELNRLLQPISYTSLNDCNTIFNSLKIYKTLYTVALKINEDFETANYPYKEEMDNYLINQDISHDRQSFINKMCNIL